MLAWRAGFIAANTLTRIRGLSFSLPRRVHDARFALLRGHHCAHVQHPEGRARCPTAAALERIISALHIQSTPVYTGAAGASLCAPTSLRHCCCPSWNGSRWNRGARVMRAVGVVSALDGMLCALKTTAIGTSTKQHHSCASRSCGTTPLCWSLHPDRGARLHAEDGKIRGFLYTVSCIDMRRLVL